MIIKIHDAKDRTSRDFSHPHSYRRLERQGFSGYLAEFPELFAQGKTREETDPHLLTSLSNILEYKKQEALFQNPESKSKESPAITFIQTAL